MKKEIRKIIDWALVLFGIFLIYQILRVIFGGSWSIEDVVLGLLIFVVGAIFTIVIMLAELKADLKHLKNQFRSLAKDFKEYMK